YGKFRHGLSGLRQVRARGPHLRARTDHRKRPRQRQAHAGMGRGHRGADRGLADAGDDPRGDGGGRDHDRRETPPLRPRSLRRRPSASVRGVTQMPAMSAVTVGGWDVTVVEGDALYAPLNWMTPLADENERAWLPCHVLLCRRGAECVLVDCGLGVFEDAFEEIPTRTIGLRELLTS